jgi:putative PEP-CTERM system TPR-repeat lipoprotein
MFSPAGRRRGVTLLLVASLATPLAVPAADTTRLYESAVHAFEQGQPKTALIHLNNLLRAAPAQLPGRVLAGKVHLQLDDPAAAEEELIHAARLGADPALTALPLAQARNQLEKYNTVIRELNPSEYPASMQADLWAELAKAYLGKQDVVAAELAFGEALRRDPIHEPSLLGLARHYAAERNFDKAAPLIEDVLRHDPTNVQALLLRGTLKHAQGSLDAALQSFAHVLEIDPGHPRARFLSGLVLLDQGKAPAAADIFGGLRAEHEFFLEAYYFHAKALRQLGLDDAARNALVAGSSLLDQVPVERLLGRPGLMRIAAMIKVENREYEAAYDYLNRFRQASPDDLAASKLLARVLLRLDRPGDAATLLSRLKIGHPRDFELIVMLGDAQAALGDYGAAEHYYGLARRELDNDPRLLERIGKMQALQSRMDDAVQTFEQVLALSESTEATVFLGMLYLSQGQVAEAEVIADRSLARNPENLAALNLKAASQAAAGDPEQARALMEDLVAKHPDFRAAAINLVRLDIREDRLKAAHRRLEPLLAAAPEDTTLLREAARLFAAAGQADRAIEMLERVRDIEPDAVRPALELIALHLRNQQPEAALGVAEDLHDRVPTNFNATLALAKTRLRAGQRALAMNVLAQAERQLRDNPGQHVALAAVQAEAGQYVEARRTLSEALRLAPDLASANLAMARLLAREERFGEASDHAERVLRSQPRLPEALQLLGDIAFAQQDYATADSHYQRLTEVTDSAQVAIRRFRLTAARGQSVQGIEDLRAWQARHRPNAQVLRLIADEWFRLGEKRRAIDAYRQLVELDPNNVLAHNNLAALLEPIDAEQALKAALRAYELAPNNAAVLDTLGWLQVKVGELSAGLANLREALVRSSRSPVIHYHLGVALHEYGQYEQAEKHLQTALSLSPDFTGRRDAEIRLALLQSR